MCAIFLFFPKKCISKIKEKCFLFHLKSSFLSQDILISLRFISSLSTHSRSNGSDESWIIMMSWTDLHKLINVIFGITQKPLCINLLKLPWWKITGNRIFLNMLCDRRETGSYFQILFDFHDLVHKMGLVL